MTPKLPIYMDNSATTACDPRVVEAMLPYFTERAGNAASRSHSFGWAAEEAVNTARHQVAQLIGASAKEITFTSGATESDNLAIKGIVEMYHKKGNHVITCQTEHKAVIDTCKHLESNGLEVTWLGVDDEGRLDLAALESAITDRTILVTLMAANNETGTLHQVADIGHLCHDKGVIFHCDATQAIGRIPIDVDAMQIDLLSMSAHKIYGPKGIGALYVRRRNPRVRVTPMIDGGGHERGMRSGTLNVTGIVGLGKACAILNDEMGKDVEHARTLRDALEARFRAGLDHLRINGSVEHRLPNVLNISFGYVEGESLLMGIKDVAVPSGSACTSASLEPSYVLRALGLDDDLAHNSIRFSVGRFNSIEEVDYAADLVIDAVKRLRDMSPLYEMALEGIDLKSVQWDVH
ncbi:MAG: IscS subfamily cysteine desulfurase [Planctomycetes bacterium]|nr:IscS subfamily cysteine desulfurase [Planctomycetota bacterium]